MRKIISSENIVNATFFADHSGSSEESLRDIFHQVDLVWSCDSAHWAGWSNPSALPGTLSVFDVFGNVRKAPECEQREADSTGGSQ